MTRICVALGLLLLAAPLLAVPGDAVAQPPAPCSDLGQNEKPHGPKHGSYEVDPIDFHLYYVDGAGTRTRLGEDDWTGTTGIARQGKWLYIIQDGKLHRVNPDTGRWFPRPLGDPTGACAWYVGWPGPIWASGGQLYAIKPNPEDPNEHRIERLYFDLGKSVTVRSYFDTRLPVR